MKLATKRKNRTPTMSEHSLVTPAFYRNPNVIFVGPSLVVNEVSSELKGTGVDIHRVAYMKELKEQFNQDTVGVIYVLPLNRSHILSVHKNLQKRKKFRDVPFFAVAPTWMTARTEREMYRIGIRMIFEWPKEKKSFANLMVSALEQDLDRVRSFDSDRSLEHAIHNRVLTTFAGFEPQIDVTSYHGIAMVKGEVPSIDLHNRIIKTIRSTPGVRGVVDQSLKVTESQIQSPQTGSKVEEVIQESYGLDHSTLDVQVKPSSRAVVLRGTVPTRKKEKELVRRLECLHGVTEVVNRVHVAPDQQKKDHFLAKRAQRMIKKMGIGDTSQVKVKACDGRLILRGHVHSPLEANRLMQIFTEMDGIDSVENKMIIDKTS